MSTIDDDSPTHSLEELNIERFYGNILNPQDIEKAIQGCDAIIHAAANTNIWPSRSEIIRRVNVEGTQNIIDAIAKALRTVNGDDADDDDDDEPEEHEQEGIAW